MMIKGVIVVLFLSGATESFESKDRFPDIDACRQTAIETIVLLKDRKDIAGLAFTCESLVEAS